MLSSKKSQNESLDLAVCITEKPEEIPGGSHESERIESEYLEIQENIFFPAEGSHSRRRRLAAASPRRFAMAMRKGC
jgi:hypothetical protein